MMFEGQCQVNYLQSNIIKELFCYLIVYSIHYCKMSTLSSVMYINATAGKEIKYIPGKFLDIQLMKIH